jgi:hypothetical protein
MIKKGPRSFKLGRDAKTGRFVSIEKAKKSPERYVVEHIPKSGYGDVKRGPRPPRKNKN